MAVDWSECPNRSCAERIPVSGKVEVHAQLSLHCMVHNIEKQARIMVMPGRRGVQARNGL